MASLYDELGVPPLASERELRTAFRQRARTLHPDVSTNPETSAAMGQLNEVWAVLGDPEARRRYDESQRDLVPAPFPQTSHAPLVTPPEPFKESSALLYLLFRPWVIVPAALLLIVVIAAYAGHRDSGGHPSPTTTTAIPPASAFVGQCIRVQPDSVLVVACSQLPNSQVIAAVPAAAACPPGSYSYQLTGQAEVLCAQPSTP